MVNRKALFLHEELLLLALRNDKGTLEVPDRCDYALAGALLAELLLRQRIAVEDGRAKTVKVIGTEPLGDALLDECLGRLGSAKRRASLRSWVSRFVGLKRLRHRVAQQLCLRGILRTDEDKVLVLFTRKVYPEVDPGPERDVVSRLREAIFTDTHDVHPRTAVLVSLAHNAELLNGVFAKRDLKSRRARIDRIINGELTGKATQEAMQAMQAAVMVAVFAATTATITL